MIPQLVCGAMRNSRLCRLRIIEDYVILVLALDIDTGSTLIIDKKYMVELCNISNIPTVVKISIEHIFDVSEKLSIESLR
jgi:hypothetical protein